MKKLFLIILIVGLSISNNLWAQSSGDFAVPLSDPTKRGKLKVDIKYGSVTVKGTTRKDVLVKYSSIDKKKGGHDDDDDHDEDHEEHRKDKGATSKEGLKRISGGTMDLEVSEHLNAVRINSDSWSTKINVEVEVPSGFDLNVSTYNNGDVLISNIQGALELDNYNGEITAENISGSVVANTYNGEIRVIFDKVTEGTPMSFSTYNGDIDLTFPATIKATLKMKTEQGEVLSGFDMVVKKDGPVQKKDTKSGVYKVVIDEWVKGEINGGGPEFSMKNYHGDIIIRKK